MGLLVGVEVQVMSEELKESIIKLVNSVESVRLLEYIYNFIEKAVTVWK